MEWLAGNSFVVVLLLVCVGMHTFGHKHGHRHGKHDDGDVGPTHPEGTGNQRSKP